MQLGRSGRGFALGAAAWIAVVVVVGSCGRPLTPIRYPSGVNLGMMRLDVELDYKTFTLGNNRLVVILAPDAESNLVTVDMRYYVGAADEPAGKTGLAHLAEHATFEVAPRGTQTLAEQLGEHALSYNASTNFDSTHYYSVALAPSLDQLLEIEALRMAATCDQLPARLFERERTVVFQELAQRGESIDVMKKLHALVWGEGHPFSHGVGGDDVGTLTREDYCAFIERHYVPSNATLIVGGNLDVGKTKALIAKHFGKLPYREPPEPQPLADLPGGDVRTAQLAVDHPATMVVYPLDPAGTDRRTLQELAIWLVAFELRQEVEKSASIASSDMVVLGSGRRSAVGFLLAGKAPRHGRLAEQILAAVKRASEKQSERFVQQLQAIAITRLAEQHDDMLGRGQLLGEHSQFVRADNYRSALDALDALDAEGLAELCRTTFSPEQARTYYIEKRAGSRATYDLANVGEVARDDLPPTLLPAAATAALPSPQLAPAYKPVELQLKNGLRVMLVPRRAGAFFEARLVFPNGDADDPAGRAGTAELAATLLQGPSDHLRLGDMLALQLAAMSGSTLSAFTTAHRTVFAVSGVPSAASLHLWRLHSLLESGDYPVDVLDQLRRQRAKQERAEADAAEDPEALAERRKARLRRAVFRRMLGADHPFLRSDDDSLDKITMEDLFAFRDVYYRIDGATLVVVGGFDPAVVERDIYELWGVWEKRQPPLSRRSPPARPEPGQAYLALDRPDSQLSLLTVFAARSQPDEASGVRRVATALLGERLRGLRLRLAATYGLSLSYLDLEGASFVTVEGRVAPDRGAAVLAALRDALNIERGDAGQLALEVARARRRALQVALAQSSSSSSIADQLASLAGGERATEQQQRQVAAIAAVTTDQVRALVKGDLDPARMVIAASGPDASKVLRAAGAAAVQLVE